MEQDWQHFQGDNLYKSKLLLRHIVPTKRTLSGGGRTRKMYSGRAHVYWEADLITNADVSWTFLLLTLRQCFVLFCSEIKKELRAILKLQASRDESGNTHTGFGGRSSASSLRWAPPESQRVLPQATSWYLDGRSLLLSPQRKGSPYGLWSKQPAVQAAH